MSNSIEELTAVTNLIHLSFHRNRNQHRLAKWWSSLSQLKRHIQKLVSELSVLDTAAQYEIKGKSKSESKYVRTAREKVEARVEFLENWLVPSCYLAFSNLIADNQYAALGLVLMGVLARVKRVIRPLGPARIVQDENENKLSTSGAANIAVILDLGEAVARGELGEVVTKDSDLDEHGEDEDHEVEVRKVKKKRKEPKEAKFKAQMQAQRVVEAIPTQRPKKKRKKGGDAFDDLFAGLI